ncbi:tetratricopeptide repeat protein [Streptomyces sp. YGL11-2]|uniref:tetratricopeptide repeat protein n=1 Tax=Streptomyces sp. YGL11-2 TaxID=3414028 RepID=UPI003CEC907A
MSRQELIRLRRREGFVGRRGELAAFRDNFQRVVEDPAHQFLFHVHGQAGVGKTSLVRQLEEIAREHGALTGYVDEAVHGAPEAMAAVSDQLASQGRPLKGFDKLIATYRERRHEAESAAAAADGPADPGDPQGAAPSPGSMIAAQAGLAGLGLLPGVGAVTGALDPGQVARGAERLRGLIGARLRNHDDVRLVLSPLQVLTPVFVREMSAVADEVPWLALFFDTYERTGPLLDTWLRDVLVSDRYGPLAPNVVVTLAGQTTLDRRCWADCLDCVADLPLDAFTTVEARQFLATRGIVDERVIEMILRLSGGLPVLVSTLAEHRPQAAEAVDDPSDTAVERFLKWESDPVRREAALAAALPRHLDEDIFRTAVDAPAAEQFGWLCGLPFVADRAGHWQYHDVVRTAMLRLQRRRSPQTWTARHRNLAEAARRRRTERAVRDDAGPRAPAGTPPITRAAAVTTPVDLWGDERQREWRLREMYHSLCADPRTALPEALDDVLDAAEYAPAVVRRVAENIRQAGEDAGATEVEEWGTRLFTAIGASDGDGDDGGRLADVLTALLARPGTEAGEQARIHRIRGREHRQAESWEQAFTDFDRCLQLTPDSVPALIGRGLTHRYLRSFERAAEDYTRALEIAPDSLEALSQLGEAHRLMGRFEAAMPHFDRALEIEPRHAFTIASRAVCLRRLGRHEEALAGLAHAIEINAQYSWAMAERGAVYRAMGQHEQALAEFDRALAVNPGYVWAYARRGITLRAMGRYDDALAALGRAAELQPNDPWIWAERCNTLLGVGRCGEALADVDRALAIDPAYAWAHMARGGILHLLGRHEEALAALDRSLEIRSDDARVWAARGEVRRRLGQYAQALADFDRAMALGADPAPTVAQRAKAHVLWGDERRALADIDQVLHGTGQAPTDEEPVTLGVDTGRRAPGADQISGAGVGPLAPDAEQTPGTSARTNPAASDPSPSSPFPAPTSTDVPEPVAAVLLVLRAGCLRRAGRLDEAREAVEAARVLADEERRTAAGSRSTPAISEASGAPGDPVPTPAPTPAAAAGDAADLAVVGLLVRYEEALLVGREGGVEAAASVWEQLRAEVPRAEVGGNGLMGTAAVAVVSRCALGDWAGAEAVSAELLAGEGLWEAIAETEMGVRDLMELEGVDTDRLEAIRDGLIRRMRATTAAPGPVPVPVPASDPDSRSRPE